MSKNLKSLVLLVVAMFLIISAAAFAEEKASAPAAGPMWPEVVNDHVKKAKTDVTVITMDDFKKIVDNKGEAVIIDVREPDEFAAGHVPGAINIPRGLVEFKIWKAVAGFPEKTNTGMKIYTYCKLGGRGILAAKALKDVGFTNVTAVGMKVDDWVKAGYPITR